MRAVYLLSGKQFDLLAPHVSALYLACYFCLSFLFLFVLACSFPIFFNILRALLESRMEMDLEHLSPFSYATLGTLLTVGLGLSQLQKLDLEMRIVQAF